MVGKNMAAKSAESNELKNKDQEDRSVKPDTAASAGESSADFDDEFDEEEDDEFVDELKPGTKLFHGQFKIERFINSGGFGITYLARDSLDRPVVIKECFPGSFCRRSASIVRARSRAHQNEYKSIVRLFVQEAKSLSKLIHPNIVGVHQVFEDNDTAYMAIDFVDGRDLLAMIEDDKVNLTPDQITLYLNKLLGAVDFIHRSGVLHRDISPDNILINENDEPILIDFGAAREEASKASRALSALRVVKDGYSPQEFYISGSLQSDSSDLYALAASFYHVITGFPPPNSQARLAALADDTTVDPYVPLAGGKHKGYKPEFLEAIDKALNVLPRDRIKSAKEWLELIDSDGKMAERLASIDSAVTELVGESGAGKAKGAAKAAEAKVVAEKPKADAKVSPKRPKTEDAIAKMKAAEDAEVKAKAEAEAKAKAEAEAKAKAEAKAEAEAKAKIVPARPKADTPNEAPTKADVEAEGGDHAEAAVAAVLKEQPAGVAAAKAGEPARSRGLGISVAAIAVVVAGVGYFALGTSDGESENGETDVVVDTSAGSSASVSGEENSGAEVGPVGPAPSNGSTDVVVTPPSTVVVPETPVEANEPEVVVVDPPVVETPADATQTDEPSNTESEEAASSTVEPETPEVIEPEVVEPAPVVETPVDTGPVELLEDQFVSTTWDVELPFSTETVEVGDSSFPMISEVTAEITEDDLNQWMKEGVIVFAINEEWVSSEDDIKGSIERVSTVGSNDFLKASVRIRTSEDSPFENVDLLLPAARVVELANGTTFRAQFVDGKWSTIVESVPDTDGNTLEVGDEVVSEAEIGFSVSNSQSVETIVAILARRDIPAASFSVMRDGSRVDAAMPLARK